MLAEYAFGALRSEVEGGMSAHGKEYELETSLILRGSTGLAANGGNGEVGSAGAPAKRGARKKNGGSGTENP
jgi:hypothetical protein